MNYYPPVLKTSDPKDWYVLYSYRHPVSGQMVPFKVRKGINRIKDLKERKQYGQKLIVDLSNILKKGWSPIGQPGETDPLNALSLQAALRKLEELKSHGLRLRTKYHYKHAIDLLCEFLPAEIHPKSFTRTTAQNYSDWLMSNKGYTAGTHNNQLSNMNIFFNALADRGIIERNPFKGIKRKPAEINTHIPFTDAEREKLKKHMEKNDPRLLLFCKFIFYCGIRPSELMALKVGQIDWELKNIRILGSQAKNRKQLSAVLPDKFFDEVKGAFQKVPPHYYLFSRNLEPGEIEIHRNRATERHKIVLKAAGMDGKGHTMYAWKHSGAIAFIKAGGEPFALMIQFRHHSFDQTMDYLRSLGLDPNNKFASKQPKF